MAPYIFRDEAVSESPTSQQTSLHDELGAGTAKCRIHGNKSFRFFEELGEWNCPNCLAEANAK